MSSLHKSQSMGDLNKVQGGLDMPEPDALEKEVLNLPQVSQKEIPVMGENKGGYDFNNIKMHDGASNVINPGALSHRNINPTLLPSPSAPNMNPGINPSMNMGNNHQVKFSPLNFQIPPNPNQEEQKLTKQFQDLINRKQELSNQLALVKRQKVEDKKKDELYSKVKDSIQIEMEEKKRERQEKQQEDEITETRGIMDMIGKQQAQLSELVRQARMENESKLVNENIQLTQRLKMLEQAAEKRKQLIASAEPDKKIKKKKKKKRKYPKMPPMYGLPPMPPPMYGGYPQPGVGNMNYPLYYNNGSLGHYPSYDNGYGNNMSGLAGVGLNAMNMTPHHDGYHSEIPRNPAEFENPNKIVDGRDINKDNKDQLKALLATQLGRANKIAHRDRPPTHN